VGHIVLGLKSDHRETPSWSCAKRDENEAACDIFASELLMPYGAFQCDVDQGQPSFDLIGGLRAKYILSFPDCASRLAAVTQHPCAFVFMSSSVTGLFERVSRPYEVQADGRIDLDEAQAGDIVAISRTEVALPPTARSFGRQYRDRPVEG
jgi:hypothetical protein